MGAAVGGGGYQDGRRPARRNNYLMMNSMMVMFSVTAVCLSMQLLPSYISASNAIDRSSLQQNSALFWYNYNPSGLQEEHTWHQGCPVVIGDKWSK